MAPCRRCRVGRDQSKDYHRRHSMRRQQNCSTQHYTRHTCHCTRRHRQSCTDYRPRSKRRPAYITRSRMDSQVHSMGRSHWRRADRVSPPHSPRNLTRRPSRRLSQWRMSHLRVSSPSPNPRMCHRHRRRIRRPHHRLTRSNRHSSQHPHPHRHRTPPHLRHSHLNRYQCRCRVRPPHQQ